MAELQKGGLSSGRPAADPPGDSGGSRNTAAMLPNFGSVRRKKRTTRIWDQSNASAETSTALEILVPNNPSGDVGGEDPYAFPGGDSDSESPPPEKGRKKAKSGGVRSRRTKKKPLESRPIFEPSAARPLICRPCQKAFTHWMVMVIHNMKNHPVIRTPALPAPVADSLGSHQNTETGDDEAEKTVSSDDQGEDQTGELNSILADVAMKVLELEREEAAVAEPTAPEEAEDRSYSRSSSARGIGYDLNLLPPEEEETDGDKHASRG